MTTDFRSGTAYPRRGRTAIGAFLWLARVTDKARAAAAGTLHDYLYPCPMDRGVFDRWGISVTEFNAAIQQHTGDDGMHAWLAGRVTADQCEAANQWLTAEKNANLDRQDAEEGVAHG